MAMPEMFVCSLLVNRLVRSRMLNGEGGLNTRTYPISYQLH